MPPLPLSVFRYGAIFGYELIIGGPQFKMAACEKSLEIIAVCRNGALYCSVVYIMGKSLVTKYHKSEVNFRRKNSFIAMLISVATG